jgi:hypothetical protein
MDRRKQLIIGLGALLLVLAAALGLSLATRENSREAAKIEEARKDATQDACASRDTFLGLKQLVFQQASPGRTADPVNFDVLSASAFARMENPVVASTDERLGLTACRGRFILELPPGAERAFNGDRRLAADVEYEVQAAADGSGPVYRMRGAEGIVARLSAFNLQGQRLQMPASAIPAEDLGNLAEPVLSPGSGTEPLPAPEPVPVPPPPPVVANPSFDCDDARTRGETMVCGSASLAAKDRAMAAAYEAARDEGDRRTRRALERTREDFLAYRDRCTTQACVSQAYDGRMREIRDILAAEN